MRSNRKRLDETSFYTEAYKTNQLGSLTIELISSCNLKCKHCYIPENQEFLLDFEKVIELIDQAYGLGVLDLLLTGGEILLRSDLLDIVKYARSKHLRVSIMSNATLITEELVESLSKLYISEFSTTLFSTDEKINDSITQINGSTKKILNSLMLLKKYRIPVQVKTPLLIHNSDFYNQVKEYCDINEFSFGSSPVIFSKKNRDKEPLNHKASKKQLETILPIQNEEEDESLFPIIFSLKEEVCRTLKYTLAIDSSGKVYPCNSFFYEVGNIYIDSLNDIWNKSIKLKNVQSLLNEQLSECIDCSLNSWCTFCPGISYGENEVYTKCSQSAKQMAELRYKLFRKEELYEL